MKQNTVNKSLHFYQSLILASTCLLMSFGFSEEANHTAIKLPTIEQHPPHEHGAANLTIAIDTNNIEIDLESPADNIFGFEYVPSTNADKKIVKDAVDQLKAAESLFTLPKGAQCHLDQVNVSSLMLEAFHSVSSKKTDSGPKKTSEHQHVHNDVDASWYYSCKSTEQLDSITLHLFSAFSPGFKHLKVEWLTPVGVSSSLIKEDKTIVFKGSVD